jgi:Flp pilus assembly protein TadG
MATLTIGVRQSERGQAIVELALTLPLLLLIVLGIFDFGLMFQRFEVVTNAAREGARVAVLPDYTAGQAATHAQNYLAAGGVSGTVVSACGGAISPGKICVSVAPGTTTIPTTPAKTVSQMVVTVEYDHQHVFVGPIVQLFGGTLGTTRLTAVSRMRKEAN